MLERLPQPRGMVFDLGEVDELVRIGPPNLDLLMGWAPTVQLQVLVRALPAPGWCLVEASASEVAGGWLDEDYRIWDSTGRLVAQSRQLARVPR